MAVSSQYFDRFSGLGRLYGVDALARLAEAHVMIVGIGGVGSWAAEAAARSGIGHITLIDLDDICTTNINRQLPAATSTVGKMKTQVMSQRVSDINPECVVTVYEAFLTKHNLREIVTPDISYVVDCIDSVKNKAALIAYCKRNKIRIVSTGAAGGQVDPTQVTIGDLNKTYNDPLLRKVRSLLRREYGFSRNSARNYSVPCVFSTEQLLYPQSDGSVCQTKQFDSDSTRLDCSGGFGSVTMVTATFGMAAMARVVARIAANAGKKS